MKELFPTELKDNNNLIQEVEKKLNWNINDAIRLKERTLKTLNKILKQNCWWINESWRLIHCDSPCNSMDICQDELWIIIWSNK